MLRIIAGRHRGRRLVAPPGSMVRPTADRAREALMSILEHGEPPLEGARFLDLFAGTGAVGLEALSRGAASLVLVESGREARAAIRRNIELLGEAARARLIGGDATRLGRAAGSADIVYLDPPYRTGLAPRAIAALLAGGWLAPVALIVAEIGARETLAAELPLKLADERRYGAARLLFLRLAPSSDALATAASGSGPRSM